MGLDFIFLNYLLNKLENLDSACLVCSPMASSAKALGELLRSPKRLRPLSPSPEPMSLKSPLSSLCTPPLAAGEHPSALTSEQANRVDADRSIARWKRNLSICSERIATSKGTHSEPYTLPAFSLDRDNLVSVEFS